MKSDKVQRIAKAVVILCTAIAAAVTAAFGLQSCEVMREVTTSQQYVQRGDTSVMIQSKTVESYTGKKKL